MTLAVSFQVLFIFKCCFFSRLRRCTTPWYGLRQSALELQRKDVRPRAITQADSEGVGASESIGGQTISTTQALSPHRQLFFSKGHCFRLPQLRLPIVNTHTSPLQALLLLLSGAVPKSRPPVLPLAVCARNFFR